MLLPIILPTPKLSSRIDSDKCNILFVGGYYYPNVNGFRWFIKNVTPLIKINYEVTLVGNRMDLLKEEFSNNTMASDCIRAKISVRELSIALNTETASCTSILVDGVSEDSVGIPLHASS